MGRTSVLMLCLVLLTSCTNSSVNNGGVVFESFSIENSNIDNVFKEYERFEELRTSFTAKFFNKNPADVNDLDYAKLRNEEYIELKGGDVDLLPYMNNISPSVKYLKIEKESGFFTKEDIEALTQLSQLKAVEIYASDGFEDISFIDNYLYGNLSFDSEEYTFPKSVEDYGLTGDITSYTKYRKDGMVYELVDSNETYDGDYATYIKSKMFVSKIIVDESDEVEFELVQIIEPERFVMNSEGFYLEDVNFDGYDDIVIQIGHQGARGTITYSCYLFDNGEYVHNQSFSEFPYLSMDKENKKLHSWVKNSASSETEWIVEYKDGEFTAISELNLTIDNEDNSIVQLDGGEPYYVENYDERWKGKPRDYDFEIFSVVDYFVTKTTGNEQVIIVKESFDDISYINDYPNISLNIEYDESFQNYIPKDEFDNVEIVE